MTHEAAYWSLNNNARLRVQRCKSESLIFAASYADGLFLARVSMLKSPDVSLQTVAAIASMCSRYAFLSCLPFPFSVLFSCTRRNLTDTYGWPAGDTPSQCELAHSDANSRSDSPAHVPRCGRRDVRDWLKAPGTVALCEYNISDLVDQSARALVSPVNRQARHFSVASDCSIRLTCGLRCMTLTVKPSAF